MEKVVIAGATGGIGKALVLEALTRWPAAEVWAIARDEAKLEQLRGISGNVSRLRTIPATLERFNDPDFADELRAQVPVIDLAIYAIGILNAKGNRPEKSIKEVKGDNLLETYRVNAVAAIDFARLIKPMMKHSGVSRYLAISAKVGSIGDNGLGGWYAYRMSKAALNMGIRNVAIEFRRSGCQSIVTAVHPGTTLSDFSRDYVSHWAEDRVASVEVTAQRLLNLSENLKTDHDGSFVHWDGTALPW